MTICEVMTDINKEFNISDLKEFNRFSHEVNRSYREGTLPKEAFAILIKGLYFFKIRAKAYQNSSYIPQNHIKNTI